MSDLASAGRPRLGHTSPGALPLRPLTTGELLDAAVVLLRTRTAKLIWLGIALAVAEQAVLFPLRRLAHQDISLLPGTGRLVEYGVLVVVGFATEAFCIALLGGAAATEAPRALLGRTAPQRPPMRFWAVLVVAIVAGGVGAFGASPFLVLLPPLQGLGIATAAFLTMLLWPVPYGLIGLAAPMVVLERRSPFAALGRSIKLASRDGLRAVWIRVLGYVAWLIVRYGLTLATIALVVLAFTPPSEFVDSIVLAAVGVLVNALAYPMLACLDVVLNLETRMRTEGLDILLVGALRRGTAADTALAGPR